MSNAALTGRVTVEMELDEYTKYLLMLPKSLAVFVEFEAAESYNPRELVEFKEEDPFLTWDTIEKFVRKASENGHRAAFGVHPSLDPPRRVW